jgi:hypothetical protein
MRHLEYTTLFRDLATRHLGIQHRPDQLRFVRMLISSDPVQKLLDYQEFTDGLRTALDLRNGQACLILENYQSDYSDNDGDFFGKEHHGAFLVLKPVGEGAYDRRDEVIDECEAIGEELMGAAIARLRAGTPGARISPADVMQEAIGPVGDGFYGVRFNFTFRSPATEELTYDPTKFLS